MATIGPVQLSIRMRGDQAVVDVDYEIAFDSYDQGSNQPYVEVCRLIGDDTATGDVPGPDQVLGFVTPLFVTSTQANGAATLKREWRKTFRKTDLDEDKGAVPDPDEIRALVSLTPVQPAAATRESNMVKKKIESGPV